MNVKAFIYQKAICNYCFEHVQRSVVIAVLRQLLSQYKTLNRTFKLAYDCVG